MTEHMQIVTAHFAKESKGVRIHEKYGLWFHVLNQIFPFFKSVQKSLCGNLWTSLTHCSYIPALITPMVHDQLKGQTVWQLNLLFTVILTCYKYIILTLVDRWEITKMSSAFYIKSNKNRCVTIMHSSFFLWSRLYNCYIIKEKFMWRN